MNNSVLQTLPQVENTGAKFALLTRLDGKSAWNFLVMPTEIIWERSASYSASGAVNSVTPYQQYNTTEGWNISMGFPLSGYTQQKSLTSYVENLANLQLPDTDKLAPPVLAFRWGQRSLAPCILTRLTKTETLWFPSGDLAACKIQISLVQVPLSQLVS